MKIDIVIANPPYGAKLNPNFHNRIMNEIKPKVSHCIAVMPLSSKVRYKTAEYVGNPFGIAWSNIFVFDLKGNKNEYYSFDNAPFFSDTKTGLAMKMNGKDLGLGSYANERNSVILSKKQEAQDFCEWVNERNNELSLLFFKLVARRPSRPFLNKLYEVYNENRCSNSKSTI